MKPGRTNEVSKRVVDKVFSGRRKGNVEAHMTRDEVRTISAASYEVGFDHGRLAAKGGATIDEAVAKAGEAQVDAIHALAQYVLENEDELREALMRDRLGDRKDIAADIRGLLKGWRDASTGVRDAAVQSAKAGRD